MILPGTVTDVPAKAQCERHEGNARLLCYDSSTLGGLAGSPVVSLPSGEVVGIGNSRIYLVGKWAVPTWQLLRDPRVRALGLAVPPDTPLPDDPWANAWAEPNTSPAKSSLPCE